MSLITSFAYDLDGRQTTRQFPNSDVTSNSYSAISQLVSVLYADATRLTMAYDPLNRLTTMQDAIGTSTFAYDPRSLLVGKTDSGNLVQAYAYDQVQNRTKLVDPDNGIRTSTFDPLNRISVFVNSLSKAVTTQYDADSRPTTQQFASGLTRVTSFDAASQTVGQTDKTPAGVVSSEFTFACDPTGNRVKIQDLLSLTSYSYDAKNQLLQDSTSGTNAHLYTYTFDGTGNRLSSSETGSLTFWTYNAAQRMVTAISGSQLTTYGYSLNGNVTSVSDSTGLTSMAYDKENRLAVHMSGATITSFAFGGDGLMRLDMAGAAITNLVWDGSEYLQGRE